MGGGLNVGKGGTEGVSFPVLPIPEGATGFVRARFLGLGFEAPTFLPGAPLRFAPALGSDSPASPSPGAPSPAPVSFAVPDVGNGAISALGRLRTSFRIRILIPCSESD